MKISNTKKEKIHEQILAFLYSISPRPVYTVIVAREIARDEEFIKRLLFDLKEKKLVVEIKKSPKGIPYLKRARWQLSEPAYEYYKKNQKPL